MLRPPVPIALHLRLLLATVETTKGDPHGASTYSVLLCRVHRYLLNSTIIVCLMGHTAVQTSVAVLITCFGATRISEQQCLTSIGFFLTFLQEETLDDFLRRGSADGREEDVFRNFTQWWVLPPDVAFACYVEHFESSVSPRGLHRRIPYPDKFGVRCICLMTSLADPMLSSPMAFSGIFPWYCLFPQVQFDMEA